MIRLTDRTAAPLEGETPIAVVRGGPWDGAVARLCASPAARDGARGAEWVEGLTAPPGSSFHPLPTLADGQRDVLFLTGASGSGKSTASADMARTFCEVFSRGGKQPNVYIVCPDDPALDPAFKAPGFEWGWLSPDILVESEPPLESLAEGDDPCLVIFDDTEAVSNRAKAKAVEAFSQACLERGRKRKIHVHFIGHRAAAGRATRVILQEQNCVWLPTNGSGSGNVKYLLEKHLGIPGDVRAALKREADSFGRWIVIRTDATPRYAITPRRAFVFDEDEIQSALTARRVASAASARAAARQEVAGLSGLAQLPAPRGSPAGIANVQAPIPYARACHCGKPAHLCGCAQGGPAVGGRGGGKAYTPFTF